MTKQKNIPLPLAQSEPGPPTNQQFQFTFPGSLGTGGLTISTIEVDYTGPHTPSLLKVTFTTTPPPIVPGQSYTFSGATTYLSINGDTLTPVGITGDTVTFVFGDGVAGYGPAADTGTTGPAAPTMLQGPGFQIPPGCTVTIEPVNPAGLNTHVCFIAPYSQALGTASGRTIAPGTGDVVVPWPVSNLCEIFMAGTAGDGMLIKVQGGGIQ